MGTPANSDETRCGGCGRPVDALRAGSVAILGGRFVYYCGQACKVDHLNAIAGSIMGDDVATAEPPPVGVASVAGIMGGRLTLVDEDEAAGRSSTPSPPASGPIAEPTTDLSPEDAPTFDPAPETTPPPDETEPDAPTEPRPAPPLASAPPPAPRTPSSPAPSAVPMARSGRAAPYDGPPSAPASSRAIEWVTVAGLVAGVMSAGVELANMDAARLPLAVMAALAAIGRVALRPRDPADAPAATAAAPIAGLVAAVAWASLDGDVHAPALALLTGLSAACVLAMELVVARTRKVIESARARVARELDVDVRVVRGEKTESVAASAVKPGERVEIDAGEIAGADGVVVTGEAQVVPWLGAPTEATKREGDTVVAGARLLSGQLRMTVTWSAGERAWAKLLLSPALRVDVTAPIAKLARAVATRGAIGAVLLAGGAAWANGATGAEIVATASAAALAFGAAGVAALVALAHADGHAQALEHGIVYKDAAGFDRAGRTDVAVVCSRGTVLMGEPEIVALEALGNVPAPRLVALAAGAETAASTGGQGHAFAGAILRGARSRGELPENVRNATAHAGLGVTALAPNGERLVVGSRALLLQEKVSVAVADARVSALEAQGRSVLLVALAGKLVGLVAMQDGLRAGARAAVQRLLDARIEPVLLSGEARETCETIARTLDIDHVRPEVLPADRGAEVRALSEGGHVVAVLGHPASDDSALGAADVAIAMSAAGSTPGEWTVQLASDDVRDAALALSLAHTTREKARIALIAGLVPPAGAILAIAFGIVPAIAAPFAALVGTVIAARAR
jgi:P-type Cu+ transporter